MQGVGFHFMHPSPAIGVMGGAQVFMVGGQQQEEVINSQVLQTVPFSENIV